MPRSRAFSRRKRRPWVGRILALLGLAAAAGIWAGLALHGAGAEAVRALRSDPATAPVEVLGEPRWIKPGAPLDLFALERDLAALGYRRVEGTPREPGEYQRAGQRMILYRRACAGSSGALSASRVRLEVSGGVVSRLEGAEGSPLEGWTAEAVRLGAFQGPVLQERRPLPLAEFPRLLVNAVLAAEDARFLEHRGVDPLAILRALKANLTGGPFQGGSTITQQVIKNRIVGNSRTLTRKANEAALAGLVERKVSKERILEIYLNEIYLGQRGPVSVVGMPAAARFYFGSDVRHLDPAQAALLAGLIASPGRFDPRGHPEEARARRDWVLGRMAELKFLAPEAAARARQQPVQLAPEADPVDPAGDVLDAVQREAERRGYSPRPSTEPLTIHTTIDPGLQHAVRQALGETLEELEAGRPRRGRLEGAVVVLRIPEGTVAALVGGKSGIRGGFHRALDAQRQTGSAFKPFVALAVMAEEKWLPRQPLEDAPLTLPTANGSWSPHNFDDQFRGKVTLREALEQSLNVPMVRAGLAAGPERVAAWARRAGIDAAQPAGAAIALGTGACSPLELARAYASLATLGRRVDPSILRSVRAGEGEAVVLAPLRPPVEALPEVESWLVLEALSGSVERGTCRNLAPVLRGVRVAAKTGTTQDGRDAWLALVTGSAVVVAWVGRDDSGPAGLSGSSAALPVVRRLLADSEARFILTDLPGPPQGVVEVEIDPATGGQAGDRCPQRVREVFREEQLPGPCRKHQSFWKRLFGGR